jgi:hypothetical protein
LKLNDYQEWIINNLEIMSNDLALEDCFRMFYQTFKAEMLKYIESHMDGNRRYIEQPLTKAMCSFLTTALNEGCAERFEVETEQKLPLVGVGKLKKRIDYRISREGSIKVLYIEQKTILRFNALGEVFFENHVLKKFHDKGIPYKFIGLFHHVYGADRQVMEELSEPVCMYVLVNDGSKYDSSVLKKLVSDIQSFWA